jgi:hypothetical protein
VYGEEEGQQQSEGRQEGRQGAGQRSRRLLIVALVVGLTPACGLPFATAARMRPRFATCPDGEPVRLLIDRRCPGGVCGYSCLPGRWEGFERSADR